MSQKILFIYNPVAGASSGKNVKEYVVKTLEKQDFEVEIFETVKAEKQPLEPYAKKKYEKVIVSGGDGTVAEVITFLVEHKLKTPLIIIPQGSANILALSLKIPPTVKGALKQGLERGARAVDVMKINQKRYGMIAVGAGYDTLIMHQTSRPMKRRWGALAYLWTILSTLFDYRGNPYKLTIDGKRETVYAKTVMIFNILPLGETKLAEYFVGQKVSATDGKLNVVALNPRPIIDRLFVRKRMKVFAGREVSIQQKKSKKFQIDGNVFKGKNVKVETLPKAVHLIY